MHTRVKICGITSVLDAQHALAYSADAIGIVFYERSVRAISDLGLAREIALSVGPFVNVVGLFVDPQPDYVESVLGRVPLDCLQFHGNEDRVFCESFERPYIKAIRMKPDIDVSCSISNFQSANGVLLDTYVKGMPGGTGETFDWERVPLQDTPIVLAGGLTPENVAQAVRRVRPYGVDVSGGVEAEPGRKDPDKIAAFVAKAKSEPYL